jgi:di/tricarboxylate transporter
MEWQVWTTVGVVGLVFVLLALTQIGADLIMLAALTVLLTAGVLSPADALAGFANEGMITVAVLFVVAAGLRETGGMGLVAQRVFGRPRSVVRAQVGMMVPVAVLSAFMNNTPLVAMMLPVVDDWAKKIQVSPSKLMMPLSFATILGGLCTLVGTSTNLVLSGLLVAHDPGQRLHMFDVAWVGLPCALAGLAYMAACSRWLLPERRPAISVLDDPKEYTVEMLVEPASALVGKTIEEAGLRHLPGLYLVEIDRHDRVLAAVPPHELLCANDRLVFAGVVDSVVDLQKIRGLKPATTQVFKLDAPRSHRCLIEAVVSNSCPLVGRTIREGRFRTLYNAAVIALARNGERVRKKMGDIVLQAGDTLLLEAHPSFADHHRNSRDFFLVSRVENSTPGRHDRAWTAAAILVGMVVAAGAGWLSMLNAAMVAAGLMILTRCCPGAVARRSIDWQVLTVIAASFGIGRAMQVSGAAEAIAQALIGPAGANPWVALAILYGVTMVFTEVMSNNAAAVLVFPIAMATAATLGVSHMPFILAIMMAASCGFATPIGYQTNLMVYGPGGYRFSDYLRFGGPLNLLVWAVTVLVAPLAWPF